MNVPTWAGYLLVAVGGALGAPLRYLTDFAVQTRVTSRMPWGIFTVNVAGSALLGLLSGLALGAGSAAWLLVGVGLCGALTTWSALSWDTARLVEQPARALAALNLAGTVVAGLAATTVGLLIGSAAA